MIFSVPDKHKAQNQIKLVFVGKMFYIVNIDVTDITSGSVHTIMPCFGLLLVLFECEYGVLMLFM